MPLSTHAKKKTPPHSPPTLFVQAARAAPPPGKEGAEADEDAPAYAGGTELLVVKEGESAWERLRARLSEAPIFQELYRRAREAQKTELGKQAAASKDRLSDKVEEAREVWETSQNPWVYRLSEVWDSMTHETDTAVVLKELRRLDPNFSLEVPRWSRGCGTASGRWAVCEQGVVCVGGGRAGE